MFQFYYLMATPENLGFLVFLVCQVVLNENVGQKLVNSHLALFENEKINLLLIIYTLIPSREKQVMRIIIDVKQVRMI